MLLRLDSNLVGANIDNGVYSKGIDNAQGNTVFLVRVWLNNIFLVLNKLGVDKQERWLNVYIESKQSLEREKITI